ncbi:hypothetical protein AAG906_004343 [Vitis piasezkii]
MRNRGFEPWTFRSYHMTFDSRQVSPLDLPHKNCFHNQCLGGDGSEGRRKSLKFGCGIDVWDMLHLVILKNCFLVCLQKVIFLVSNVIFMN